MLSSFLLSLPFTYLNIIYVWSTPKTIPDKSARGKWQHSLAWKVSWNSRCKLHIIINILLVNYKCINYNKNNINHYFLQSFFQLHSLICWWLEFYLLLIHFKGFPSTLGSCIWIYILDILLEIVLFCLTLPPRVHFANIEQAFSNISVKSWYA